MKALITTAALCIALTGAAQTPINKTVPVTKGQTIRMKFDYPGVKISTWDRDEIAITGTATINNGENDDAFKINVKTSASTIVITSEIENMDRIPQRITIHEGDQKIIFKNKGEWQKYQETHGRSNTVNMGVDLDIKLEIKVPRNVDTDIEAVYGMVEIPEFIGPLTVQATYGGVDASLSEKNVGELIAETNYGNIYSNLDMNVKTDNAREEDFHTLVRANLGTGPRYKFESPYGNVYLRKK
jgi:hypothetical protein